jgi:hypothetical protein
MVILLAAFFPSLSSLPRICCQSSEMYGLNALSTRLYYLAALSKQHTSSAPSSLSSIIFLQLS